MFGDDQNVLNDIQDVDKKVSITPSIPGAADAAGSPLDLEKIQLHTTKAEYLQPLATFNTIAKAISNVSLPSPWWCLLTQWIHLDQSIRSNGTGYVDCSLRGMRPFFFSDVSD